MYYGYVIKFLPIVVIVGLIAGVLFIRFSASNSNQSFISAQQIEPVEVPKTSPGAPIEDQVSILEEAITKLVVEVNKLKTQVSENKFSSAEGSSVESRLSALETAVVDLKSRVGNLEQPGTTMSQTKTPLYIPLGSGGSTTSQDWVTLGTYEITLSPSDYSGYSSMQLEVSMRNNIPGTSYARLLNSSDGTAVSPEVSTTSTSFAWYSSSGFTLSSGQKTYKLQIKTTSSNETFIQSARLKVNF